MKSKLPSEGKRLGRTDLSEKEALLQKVELTA